MASDIRTWINLYAKALGADKLSEAEVDAVLELAGVAAHASERTAAPVSCWLAAAMGIDPSVALTIAKEVAASMDPTS